MEIIGRFIVMSFLMAVASGIGLVCALLIYFLLRRHTAGRKGATIAAALFPPGVMAYLLCFVICSSILSSSLGTPDLLFGDIDEPLPNGFHLSALDKMPEDGVIEKKNGNSPTEVAWVSDLQVVGQLVAGKYGYTYLPRTAEESDRNFFLFDSRSGTTRDFATELELAKAVDTPLHLTPTEYFHAPRLASHRVLDGVLFLIALGPPIAVGLWLLGHLRRLLQSTSSPDAPDSGSFAIE